MVKTKLKLAALMVHKAGEVFGAAGNAAAAHGGNPW